jgi:hypothetical protein
MDEFQQQRYEQLCRQFSKNEQIFFRKTCVQGILLVQNLVLENEGNLDLRSWDAIFKSKLHRIRNKILFCAVGFRRFLANKLPAGSDSAQPACALSGVEGCEVEGCTLSEVEGDNGRG